MRSLPACRFLFALVCFAALPLFAQDAPLDSTRLLSDEPLKWPMGAVMRSALLPGWGQVYNESYSKALFTTALNGSMIWRSVYFHRKSQDVALPPLVRRNAKNRRNASNWLVGITYTLTLVDAYVDAWLFGFDEAIDIAALPPDEHHRAGRLLLRIAF